MTLLSFLLFLAFAGVGLYLFNTFVTAIDPRIKRAITAIVLTIVGIVALVWLFGFFGFDTGIPATGWHRRC